ncbi:MAG: S46 family peptidase [Pseudomonadota bacterium]
MKSLIKATTAFCLSLSLTNTAAAKEGMWTPQQLPDIARDLRKTGLKLKPAALTDLTAFPMGAVISLGGCSASFVSETGLIVTNHHCARGSVQYNSTAENNYLENGFFAQTLQDEVPAAPGSRVYVTTQFSDVSDQILTPEVSSLNGLERYEAIETAKKSIIKDCESDPGHRCQVSAFYGGSSYKLIKRLEIQDVRLVYAPADAIGKYGGDIDNWQWPRHTGDFAFYRAYVAPGGAPALFDTANVPFKPKHVLKVSAGGLDDGDFVMAAGYPGRTQRYRRLAEIKHVFSWSYPTWIDLADLRIATIESAAPEGSDAHVKYASLLAGLNNYSKNRKGQIEGARRTRLAERRADQEAAFDAWAKAETARAPYLEAVKQLDTLIDMDVAADKQAFWDGYAQSGRLLSAAKTLYRLAKERGKPDGEREAGFQERDLAFIKQGLEAIERRYENSVDKALWAALLERYLAQPATIRNAAFDTALGLTPGANKDEIAALLSPLYEDTQLNQLDTRLGWMEADASQFETSEDPFIKLAVALYPSNMAKERAKKDRAGALQRERAQYMEALIAWKNESGEAVYPDANSTLRVTYGTVLGGSPKDGLIYEPFTRLEGILAKDSGAAPFNAPKKQLDLISEADYGPYALKSIGSVPVNFLTDLDSTGGNSGSATFNRHGHLVGLLFDGTIESVNSDWDFDARTTRTIHVDTRYMLWVMEKVDKAERLLNEMTIVRKR